MTELNPTKTRLALLRGVAAGEVDYFPAWGNGVFRSLWRGRRQVTARIEEMMRVGWVRKGKAQNSSLYTIRPIEITPAGQAVLDAHGGAR